MEKDYWEVVSGDEKKPSTLSPSTGSSTTSDTVQTPTESTTPRANVMAWRKKARQALGILCLYISQNLKHHIEPFAGGPAGAWLHLKDAFGKNTPANIGRLKREYTTIKYDETKSMADHLEYMEQLAHEIGATTGKALDESDRAVAMLQSMPASYDIMVQSIEGNDRGTDPMHVYTKLVSEEQRRNRENPKNGMNNKDETALNASH